jgi:hypothetical protein
MKRYFLVLILLCWGGLSFAEISTQISRSTVQLSETFRLVFTIEAPVPDSMPDLTPLLENFSILGTERSMAYSLVNGEKHTVNQWIILLVPQKTGVLLIPSIKIGPQQTSASSIEVTKDKTTTQTPSDEPDSPLEDDVILKTEVSSSSIFINKQMIYTVKLYNHQRLIDAEYQPPQIEDALLIPLGDGRHYQTMMNDRNYAVEEQQYAIFPQKSGQFTLVGPSFKALVFGAVPKRVRAKSKATTLSVKPIPLDYTGKDWLPAKQLALTEVYDQTEGALKQGSTLTRTVTLQASGIPAQLLPNLEFPSNPKFNSYPEKPEQRNIFKQGDLIGRTDTKITYILNTPGKITLPPLEVSWFNIKTGKEEKVSLPAHTIVVSASSSASPATNTTSSIALNKPSVILPKKHLLTIPVDAVSGLVGWIFGGMVLIGITGLLLFRLKKPLWRRVSRQRLALKKLYQACNDNNPKEAQEALFGWARDRWPEVLVLNLHQLAKLTHDAALKKQLFILSECLYSQESEPVWKGEGLSRSISIYLRMKTLTKQKGGGLPPINPR